jgi:hypothetical protein
VTTTHVYSGLRHSVRSRYCHGCKGN